MTLKRPTLDTDIGADVDVDVERGERFIVERLLR
jgi:hypothetical protein